MSDQRFIIPAPDMTSEQVIARGRVVLSVGGLLAIAVDHVRQPEATLEYVVLLAYVAFSFGLLIVFYRDIPRYWKVVFHGVEIGLLCVIIGDTDAPTSPLFVCYTFLLVVATLRWQGGGALISTLLSILLTGLSVSSLLVCIDQADIDQPIRPIYLLVASALVAFLGDQLARSQQRSERLQLAQHWPDGLYRRFSQDIRDREKIGQRSLLERFIESARALRLLTSSEGVELITRLPRLSVAESRR